MEDLLPLASALGLGMLAGARLYATVFVVGLLLRFQWIAVPEAWQHVSVAADTRVLIFSGAACAIEFIADKVPWVDSAWDSIHTFIRPIGAALLASSLFSNVDPVYRVLLFLLAGGIAFSGHSAKAAARLAVNHSPEPFSNIALSFTEDALVAGGLYLLVAHPWVIAGIALAFLALCAWLIPRSYRALRAEQMAIGALWRRWLGDVRQPRLIPDQQRWLEENRAGQVPHRVFDVIATADLRGLRNIGGTLCLMDGEAVFFARKWRRPVVRQVGPLRAVEATGGLLLDELALIGPGEQRYRFDLLAGQLESAREETKRRLPSSPAA